MARTNYKCPECNRFTGINGAYCDGPKKHRCKFCGCKVTVKVTGTYRWAVNWTSLAFKRGKRK